MKPANYSIQTYCRMIAYGNWIFAILFAVGTLLDIVVTNACIKTTSRILSQNHDQGTRQLGEMVISSQNSTLGLLLALAGFVLANGALFFWISKKIKLKYDDR